MPRHVLPSATSEPAVESARDSVVLVYGSDSLEYDYTFKWNEITVLQFNCIFLFLCFEFIV